MPTKEQIRKRVEAAAESKLAKAIDREAEWKASQMVQAALADTPDDDSGEYPAVATNAPAPASAPSVPGAGKVTIISHDNPRLHGHK